MKKCIFFSALNMQIDENPGGQVNGGSNFRKHYKQGNSIQEVVFFLALH